MDATFVTLTPSGGETESARAIETDRRRHVRHGRDETGWLHMRLRTGDPLAIVNISDGGALVDSSRPLLPGTATFVHLSATDRVWRVRAKVVRCFVCALKADGAIRYRAALEFAGEG